VLADVVRNRYGRIDAESVQRHLLLSADNPSSVYSCLHAARECARAQRVAITAEMYEDLNVSWLEMRGQTWSRLHADGVNNMLERVKGRSASFRGVTIGTLGRGEGYHFLQLGRFRRTRRLGDPPARHRRQRGRRHRDTRTGRCRLFPLERIAAIAIRIRDLSAAVSRFGECSRRGRP
jgi:hypothetical protein